VFQIHHAAAQENENTPEIEELVVTGSYIRGSPEDAPSPVSVTTREELDAIGNPSLIEMLRVLGPSSGIDGETNQFQSNGLEGSSNVNLRGLGAGRTLVLLNGNRVVRSPFPISESGQQYTNTNVIPTIAIKRVEILLDGASATYGSDALAGVVNFFTRSDFRGLEISGSYKNIAESDGDWELGAIYGLGTERLDVVVSFGYQRRNELLARDTDWAVRPADTNPLSTTGIPNPSAFLTAARSFSPAQGAFVPTPAAECRAVGGVALPIDLALTVYNSGNTCRFRYSDYDNVTEEETHWQGFIEVTYEINDDWKLNGELLWAFDEVPQWKSSPSYPPQSLFGMDRWVGPGMPHFDDFIDRNPGIAPSFTDSEGTLQGAMVLGRPYGVSGPAQEGSREYSTQNLRISLDGEFDAGLAVPVLVDFDLSYGISTGERFTSDLRIDRYAYAYRGLGGPDCNIATGVPGSGNLGTGNCYYYNPFTSGYTVSSSPGAIGAPPGSENPQLHNNPVLRNWLLQHLGQENTTSQWIGHLVLSGQGVSVGHDHLNWAAGLQVRQDNYEVDPNDIADVTVTPCAYGLDGTGETYSSADAVAAGQLAANPFARDYIYTCEGNGAFHFLAGLLPFEDDQTVTALFGEVGLPLHETIDIQIAVRFEDYSDVGNTLDPKLAVRWQPIDPLSLRASIGTSFRAPTLNQLSGRVTSLQFVAPTSSFKAVDSVGNSDLSPEEATNINIGVIIQPSENLTLSLDYWQFNLESPVALEPFNAIISTCSAALAAANPGDLANVGRTHGSCSKITFQDPDAPAASGVQRIAVNYINGPDTDTSGFDYVVNLDIPTNAGLFSVGAKGTIINEYEVASSTFTEAFDAKGRLNFTTSFARPLPEHKSTLHAAWAYNNHNLRLELNYISSYDDEVRINNTRAAENAAGQVVALVALPGGTAVGDVVTTLQREIEEHITVDLNYNVYLVESNLRLFASISNLFDEAPPLAMRDLSYDPYTHAPFGRIIKIGAQYTFGR